MNKNDDSTHIPPTGGHAVLTPASMDVFQTKIDAYLSPYHQHGRLAGGVVIVEKDHVIFQNAYGLADQSRQGPNRIQTPFMLASVTKPLTALAVLQLAEKGALDLHAPIIRYLPDYPQATGNKITVHHLLTHTSGIPDLFSSGDDAQNLLPDSSRIGLDALIAKFQDRELEFSPGNKQEYSNSNYFLLTKIIERVSGVSYADYLTGHIFEPAGMSRSFYPEDLPLEGVARPYYGFGLDARQESDWSPSWAAGAGGVFSTLEDLGKFFIALQSGKLLSQPYLERYFHPQVNANLGNYGYGWEFGKFEEATVLEHSGATPGYVTYVVYAPTQQLFLAFFTNHTHGLENLDISVRHAHNVLYDLLKLKHGKEVASLPRLATVDAHLNRELEGAYTIAPQTSMRVVAAEDAVILTLDGPEPVTVFDLLYQQPETRFAAQAAITQEVFKGFQANDFRPLRKHAILIIKMMALFSSKIEEAYAEITAGMGAMERFVIYRIEKTEGKTLIAHVWAKFERRNVLWRLFFGGKKVKGIKFYANYAALPANITGKIVEGKRIFVDGFQYGITDLICTVEFAPDDSIAGIRIGTDQNSVFAKKVKGMV